MGFMTTNRVMTLPVLVAEEAVAIGHRESRDSEGCPRVGKRLSSPIPNRGFDSPDWCQLLEDEARRADGDSHEVSQTHSPEKSASNFGQCGVEGHASEQLAADTTSMFKHGSGSVTSMQPQQVSSPATVHSFIAHPQPLFRIEFEQGRVRV
jgi:hypothetical protein